MSKPKTRISKLTVREVSLVDRPANPAARAVLAKRADPAPEEEGEEAIGKTGAACQHEKGKDGKCKTCGAVMKAADADGEEASEIEKEAVSFDGAASREKLYTYQSAIGESVRSIFQDGELTPAKKKKMLATSIDQYRDSILALVPSSSPDAAEATNKRDNEGDQTMSVQNQGDAPAEDVVTKAQVTEIEKRAQEAIEKAARLEEELAKRDRVAKAERMVGTAPVEVAKVADLLKGLDADGEALVADLLTKLNTAQSEAKVLAEIGKSGNGPAADSPEAKLEKIAEDLRKADTSLTPALAYERAMEQNPDLADAAILG